MIDIDSAELSKPTLHVDLPVHAEVAEAIQALEVAPFDPRESHREYLAWCRERVARYPVVLKEYWDSDEPVNPYCFVQSLFDALEDDDIVVTADGSACVITFQAADLKTGQRLFTNSGCASMGYELPAAVGAAYARTDGRVVCIAGDGSIMLNLQEMQTIVGNKLPVKLFILNNEGYSSIRQTQNNYFADNIVGCGPESGLTFPDFGALGAAFGFGVNRCNSHIDLPESIRRTLKADGPQLLEVFLDPEQPFSPKLAFASTRRRTDGVVPARGSRPFSLAGRACLQHADPDRGMTPEESTGTATDGLRFSVEVAVRSGGIGIGSSCHRSAWLARQGHPRDARIGVRSQHE